MGAPERQSPIPKREQANPLPLEVIRHAAEVPLLGEALSPQWSRGLLADLFTESPWTGWHSLRVGLVVNGLLGHYPDLITTSGMDVSAVRAGVLHDNGKVGNPDISSELLDSTDIYDDEQRAKIKTHAPVGAARVAAFDPVAAMIVRTHHGITLVDPYPLGIPPRNDIADLRRRDLYRGRVCVAVADVVDAAMSQRPEKGPAEEALERLNDQFGPYITAGNLPLDLLETAVDLRTSDPRIVQLSAPEYMFQ